MSEPEGAGLERFTGELVLGLAAEAQLRWAAVELTGVAEEARLRHDLSPIAASALGRALAGAMLLQRLSARTCRRVTLTVDGDGPLGRVVAEADAAGHVRGRVDEPRVDLPAGPGGRIAIGAAVGRGTLRVARELADGSTWESQVALETGELGLDLAHYLEQSEQIRSAVLVGVLEGPDGIRAAGGMIVEALPGASDEVVGRVEANVGRLGGVSRRLASRRIDLLVEDVLAGLDREAVERAAVRFRCGCRRDTLLPHLARLDEADRESLADERGLLVAECAFCGQRYVFASGELEAQ